MWLQPEHVAWKNFSQSTLFIICTAGNYTQEKMIYIYTKRKSLKTTTLERKRR